MSYKEYLLSIDQEIKKANSIVILRHTQPDPDAIGSQIGLAHIIRETYPHKKVYVLGEMREDLAYIGKMDKISEAEFNQALIIAVDTADTPRIDSPYPVDPSAVIKIDHHIENDVYGKISYVDVKASSTSEIICQFTFDEDSPWVMTAPAANALYAGIVGDTGRFLYPSTTEVTFEMVSKLLTFNVNISQIAYHMIEKPLTVSRLAGYIYQNIEISELGVASMILSQSLLQEFQIQESQTHSVVSIPSTIQGIHCWGLFVEQPDGSYRCNLRSKGPNVNVVAVRHNGGGHLLASGAVVSTREEVLEMIQELNQSAKIYLDDVRE